MLRRSAPVSSSQAISLSTSKSSADLSVIVAALVLPIMRSSTRNGDADKQGEKQDGDENDQEYRHAHLPQGCVDCPKGRLPIASERQTNPVRVMIAAAGIIGLAAARTAVPSGTSRAMQRP